MIKNLIILVFFALMIGSVFTFVKEMSEATPKFKKGLKQHLLRNNK